MENIGTIAILLLFGMGFALYVGSGGEYGVGFTEFLNSIAENDLNGIVNLVGNALIGNVVGLGMAVVAAAIGFLATNSAKYGAGILVMAAVASTFITPFTFYKDIPMPTEIMWLIQGFFNLVLLIAIIQFITEKRW